MAPVEPSEPNHPDATVRLLDCGAGRRLEQLGPYLIDRPAPASAAREPADPERWRHADARYERSRGGGGRWLGAGVPAGGWLVPFEGLTFELRLTDTGQVGLFPEQVQMWRWLRRDPRRAAADHAPQPLRLHRRHDARGGRRRGVGRPPRRVPKRRRLGPAQRGAVGAR